MALGKVNISTAAPGAPTFAEPEGTGLFIGVVTSGGGALQAIGPETDLVAMFGAALNLVNTLEAARENGGPNWKAWAFGHAGGDDWDDVIDEALAGCAEFIEFLVVCKPVTAGAGLTAIQTELTTQLNTHRRLFAIAAFRGIDNTPSTGDDDWSAYLVAAAAVPDGIAAPRVIIRPNVFGRELGTLAGRLQKVIDERAPKISRSPMRVASGAIVNPGAERKDLVDATGALLTETHLETLDEARFSVNQWYEGRKGIYFADGNLLVADGSDDPPVIEWLRLLDKAARRIRQLAIGMIADDEIEDTPGGNANTETRLGLPLRQMERLKEIKPGWTITVSWPEITKLRVRFKVRPPNSPKDIDGEILLDTSSEG